MATFFKILGFCGSRIPKASVQKILKLINNEWTTFNAFRLILTKSEFRNILRVYLNMSQNFNFLFFGPGNPAFYALRLRRTFSPSLPWSTSSWRCKGNAASGSTTASPPSPTACSCSSKSEKNLSLSLSIFLFYFLSFLLSFFFNCHHQGKSL